MTIITHNQTYQSSRFRRNFTGERFLMQTAAMANKNGISKIPVIRY